MASSLEDSAASRSLRGSCPFSFSSQLNDELSKRESSTSHSLPGYPRILLDDHCKIREFLGRELVAKDLEILAPKLWWMSKQDSANISPLHRQLVKKRKIIITEDPRLHLVWIYDRIFVKPLPEYLMSYEVWKTYLTIEITRDPQHELLRRSALGFLRTYLLLVQHPSDFRIAQHESLQLLPTRITWKQFCDFSSQLEHIKDSEVAGRYHYGEIRLTRLNFYAKFLLHKWHFHRIESQYALYFAQFYGPILFIFAVLSVLLSAMQVEIAVEQVGTVHTGPSFERASRGCSVATLMASLCLILGLMILLSYKIMKEWSYALRDHSKQKRRWNRGRTDIASRGSGRNPV